MNKEAQHTLIFIIVLIVVFLSIDWAFGKAAYKILSASDSGANYPINKAKHECIILGSSRASHHYDTKIISDSLGYSTFNAGCNGHGITFSYGIWLGFLKYCTPKMLIVEVGQEELCEEYASKIETLKPFYKAYPEIYDWALYVNGRKEAVKGVLNSYCFNSEFFSLVSILLNQKKGIENNGYQPLYDYQKEQPYEIRNDTTSLIVDRRCYEALLRFKMDCQRNGIRLIAFNSPKLLNFTEKSVILRDMMAELGIEYKDYTNDPYFMAHKEYFWDYVHLNNEGAKAYTKRIINDLK